MRERAEIAKEEKKGAKFPILSGHWNKAPRENPTFEVWAKSCPLQVAANEPFLPFDANAETSSQRGSVYPRQSLDTVLGLAGGIFPQLLVSFHSALAGFSPG